MANETKQLWSEVFDEICDEAFDYKTVKQMPSKWVEENIILPKEVSRIQGAYRYHNSPYVREIIDRLHPSDSTRMVAVMKGSQSGITMGLVVPGMMWIVNEHPENFLFTSKDKDVAKRTMRTKFDLVMQKSGFKDVIKSNKIDSKTKRTGDTDYLKEFAGGSGIIESTQNIQKFREFSVKTIFMDEFDTAPKNDKTEGSLRTVVEGRQNSYGNLAKTFYVSTPTTTQNSNIYEAYKEGDQRKWHWQCPECGEWFPMDWNVKLDNGKLAGMTWKLDKNNKLITDSIAYKCHHCFHPIKYTQKNELNVNGKWIPTAEPIDDNYVSYSFNSLILPPGFISWLELVKMWLKACPPKKEPNIELLKAFNNQHLGLPFEEKGETPRINQLMKNIRDYEVGTVPDETSVADGNGSIVFISLAADLGGIMNPDDNQEDVRVDWEILATSENGVTYSIDQGSIGTFKRKHTKSKKEIENDDKRKKYTYMHGQEYSVWPYLEEIIRQDLVGESGELYGVKLSLIDTGHFTTYANQFISQFTNDLPVYGIKGITEKKYRAVAKDTPLAKKSTESAKLYLVYVDKVKDELANYMKLRVSDDGSQSPGFMNFPMVQGKKYRYHEYFKHFESEERREVKENGEVVGFKWDKRNSNVENHFWDVRVYNLSARYIWIDLIKRSNPTFYRHLDWASFVEMVK